MRMILIHGINQQGKSAQIIHDDWLDALRATYAKHGPDPLGRLSRGIAGIRGQAIICNTPGSPKGCIEQLAAIIDVLPHALRLLADAPTQH